MRSDQSPSGRCCALLVLPAEPDSERASRRARAATGTATPRDLAREYTEEAAHFLASLVNDGAMPIGLRREAIRDLAGRGWLQWCH